MKVDIHQGLTEAWRARGLLTLHQPLNPSCPSNTSTLPGFGRPMALDDCRPRPTFLLQVGPARSDHST